MQYAIYTRKGMDLTRPAGASFEASATTNDINTSPASDDFRFVKTHPRRVRVGGLDDEAR